MSTATTSKKKAVAQTSDGQEIRKKSKWGPGTIWSFVAWVAGIAFFFPVLLANDAVPREARIDHLT